MLFLFVQVYCAPNAPVRRHHVVDGAFSVRGRDLPHGDDTLYIGIAGAADITRNLTKQEMLNPPGTLTAHPPIHPPTHPPTAVFLVLSTCSD